MARPLAEDRAARAVQLRLFQLATPARRLELARSLSTTTMTMARAAIARRHPGWSERDILLEYLRVHYGAAIADEVRRYLTDRER